MAILNTVVRITAGLVVSVFQYSSDFDLYRLMVTEGTVEVLRDGVMTSVDQINVVPGDIVRLTPGGSLLRYGHSSRQQPTYR